MTGEELRRLTAELGSGPREAVRAAFEAERKENGLLHDIVRALSQPDRTRRSDGVAMAEAGFILTRLERLLSSAATIDPRSMSNRQRLMLQALDQCWEVKRILTNRYSWEFVRFAELLLAIDRSTP